MPNKAQQELEALLEMQGEAEDAGANLAKLEQARTEFVVGGAPNVGSALPEALFTAAGIGWVLGPVGGILIGLAQGILGHQARQGMLDDHAAVQETLRATNEVFDDEFDRMYLAAKTDEDREQITSLQTQRDAAMKFASSAHPELRDKGLQMMTDMQTNMNAFQANNESQQIEADAFDAQLTRDLEKDQKTDFIAQLGNFTAESAKYEEVMLSTDVALDALTNGTPVDLWAASVAINKALDPESVVRESEREALSNLGSIWQDANVMLEKARSGQTLLPQQRKEMQALLYSIRENNTEFQLAREARYSDLVVNDLKLPAKYHNNFRIASGVPASVQGEMKNIATLPTEDIDRAAADAIFPYTDQGIALNLKYTWGNFKNWAQGGNPLQRQAELEATQREQAAQTTEQLNQ